MSIANCGKIFYINQYLKTVSTILNELAERGLIKKRNGAIMISPELFYRGDKRIQYKLIKDFKTF